MNNQCCEVEKKTMLVVEIDMLAASVARYENLLNRLNDKVIPSLTSANIPVDCEKEKGEVLTARANSVREIRIKVNELNDTLESMVDCYQG